MEEQNNKSPNRKNIFYYFFANHKQTSFFLLGTLGLVVLDLLSKWAAQLQLAVGKPLVVIPNFFYLALSHNTGAAFSAGADWGLFGRILGIALSLLMSIGILIYWIHEDKRWNNIYRSIAMLVLAGAVGNLIDRSFYWKAIAGFDGVIDFLQFYLGGGPNKSESPVNPFATFNLADAFLVIGIVYFLIVELVFWCKNQKNDPLTEDPRKAEESQAESSLAPEEENGQKESKDA